MGWFTKTLTDHNNDGQKDASEGRARSEPNSTPPQRAAEFFSSDIRQLNQAERDSYNAGYDNANKK